MALREVTAFHMQLHSAVAVVVTLYWSHSQVLAAPASA